MAAAPMMTAYPGSPVTNVDPGVEGVEEPEAPRCLLGKSRSWRDSLGRVAARAISSWVGGLFRPAGSPAA